MSARTRAARVLHWAGLPFTWLMVGLIKVYQLAISPMLGQRCRFYPSCSAYAVGALKTHGPLKGPLLSGYRICRCNPWNDGGLDPVPNKGAWLPDIYADGKPRHPHLPDSDHHLSEAA